MEFDKKRWKTVSDSFIAGTFFSFPISLAVCSLALGFLSEPIPNAILGIAISFVTYTLAFAFLRRRSVNNVVFGLAGKTAFEMALRGLIHGSLMYAGIGAAWASAVAQLLAGFVGHLSVTLFVKESDGESI